MYHIPNDKRAYKSAALLQDGLVACLKEKPLSAITISDLHRASGVSRATFYRLFDAPADILDYRCDQIFTLIEERMAAEEFASPKAVCSFFIDQWIANADLLEMIVNNHLENRLYQQHLQHAALVATTLQVPAAEQLPFTADLLTAIMPPVLAEWVRAGKQDSAEQLVEKIRAAVSQLLRLWE